MISSLSIRPPVVLQSQGKGRSAGFELKVFGAGTDKTEIYKLRYRAFIETGVIAERDDKLFFDEYDELPSTTIIGAYQNDVCFGSFRLAFSNEAEGPCTMPCQSVFSLVDELHADGVDTLVEFGRMVIEPSITNTSFRATLYGSLVRAGLVVADAADTDYGLIACHPNMVGFYQMMCGFNELARADDYPGINAPTVLLGRDFATLNNRRSNRNRFFKITPHEVTSARSVLFSNASRGVGVAC